MARSNEANKKVYPDWVQKYREKGTAIKKVGNNYYLYKHSSKRVPGKKYPVPVDTYAGRITPEGIVKTERRKIEKNSDIIVKEFGMSRAIELLCPEGWKKPLGEEWRKVLDLIIYHESPETYIADAREITEELDPRIQFGAQVGLLSRRMFKEHGAGLNELRALRTIYLVRVGGKNLISVINPEQAELLDKLGITLEVE